MATSDIVAPRPAGARPNAALRQIGAAAALLALAACVAIAVQRANGHGAGALASAQLFGASAFHSAQPAAVREGSVRGSVAPKFTPPGGDVDEYGLKQIAGAQALALKRAAGGGAPPTQALAFGDAKVVHEEGAAAREGSVRGGVKPDFKKPLGDLGEVGLAKQGAVSGLHSPSAKRSTTQTLAFGDAKVVKDADASAREGSVRHGVKPDFVKPLGDLGHTGLAAKPSTPVKQQQLAFGDAAFHGSVNAAAREGSVRGSVKPDFKKPLGDLGEIGLAAAKGGKKMTAAAARSAMKEFYSQQATALKKSPATELTARAATAQLSGYFSTLAAHDAQEHSQQLQRAIADEKKQGGTVGKYYSKLAAADAKEHAAAVSREHAQDAKLHPAKKAAAADKKASDKKAAAGAAHTRASQEHARPAPVAQRARAQELSETLGKAPKLAPMAFGKHHAGEKLYAHGFVTRSMARSPAMKKEIAEANKIARDDVDDAMI